MKRQKKYHTEDDVLKDITKCERKIVRLGRKAQDELNLEEMEKGCDLRLDREHGELADRLLGKIKRLRETRIVRLGRTLAEMRTIPLGATNGVAGLMETQTVLQGK